MFSNHHTQFQENLLKTAVMESIPARRIISTFRLLCDAPEEAREKTRKA